MPFRRLVLAVAATVLCAPPALAKPVDFAKAVADPLRSEDNRKLDEGRHPAEVLAFSGVAPGQSVVDFMAGGGYYTELLAQVVGPTGTVYATDPPSFHDAKSWNRPGLTRPNIRLLLQPLAQAQLATHSIDTIFAHMSYHDLYWESKKYEYPRLDVPRVLANWFAAVRPGGHVVIVDHVGLPDDPRVSVEKFHRIDPERVKADMAAAGFVLEEQSNLLQRSEDAHDKSVFDPAIRGKTDRFMLKFRHP